MSYCLFQDLPTSIIVLSTDFNVTLFKCLCFAGLAVDYMHKFESTGH